MTTATNTQWTPPRPKLLTLLCLVVGGFAVLIALVMAIGLTESPQQPQVIMKSLPVWDV